MNINYEGRPTVFNNTINKKTPSQKANEIRYEHGSLPQENRIFVENTINDVQQSKMPAGYDGTPIIKETIKFEEEYPCLSWKSPDLLYDKMMNDARNVFPRNRDLKVKVNDYYSQMIRINLNNIYDNAPRFFTDNFMPRAGVNNAAFEAYQVYIYLLCFIYYTDNHRNEPEIRELDNIETILNWIATRRDPSIGYIISGPVSNSNMSNNDFRAHYKTLISPSNNMNEIVSYNQLSTTQTISTDLYNLLNFIQNAPNVFIKTPDEARKYNINIDSSKDVLVKIDNENNLVFDCNNVNLGDTTEQNKLAKYDDLDTVITNNIVNSVINTKKMAELFHNYSRIKILELIFSPDTYITSLDVFRKVFVVFKGVSCSERNIYNTIPTNFLKIGGSFKKTNRGYEFVQDVDAITYKSVLADVKSFEIYLTTDPSSQNQIIPNEYALLFTKDNVYQHPIATNNQYNPSTKNLLKSFEPMNMITHNVIYPSFESKENKTIKIDNLRQKITDLPTFQASVNRCLELLRDISNNTNNSSIQPFISKLSSLVSNISQTSDAEDQEILTLINNTSINALIDTYDVEKIIKMMKLFVKMDEPDWLNISVKKIKKNIISNRLEDVYVKLNNTEFGDRMNEFMNNYDNIDVDSLGGYFNTVLSAIHPDKEQVIDLNELDELLEIYSEAYSIFLSLIIKEYDATKIQVLKRFKYNNLIVDTSTGKINDKYFRIGSDGNIKFTDNQGNEYQTPSSDFLIYTENENDLCLYNLYKIYGDVISPVINGTFLYSEVLKTIQNLPYLLETYTKTNDLVRFDNIFNVEIINNDTKSFKLVHPYIENEEQNNITWKDINQNYDNTNYSYYKIVRIETDAIDEIVSIRYKFIEIDNNTKLSKETSNENSELANLVNSYITETDKSGEEIYYEGNNTITISYYKKSIGLNDVNLYYKYYNPYILFVYETDEWNIEVILDDFTDLNIERTFENSTLTFNIPHEDINFEHIECHIDEIEAICDIKFINDEWFVYGTVYENNKPKYIISGKCTDMDKITNSEIDYYTSVTFNGVANTITYGSFKELTIKDQFGNTLTFSNDGNVKIVNNSFDSLDELIGNTVSQKGKDSYNTIIVQYKLDNDILSITNSKELTVEQRVVYNILHIDINNLSIINEKKNMSMTTRIDTEISFNYIISSNDYDMWINTAMLNKLLTYENNINVDKSNCYKAYEISGIDIKNTYWNSLMFINSLLTCKLPIDTPYRKVVIPEELTSFDVVGLDISPMESNTFVYHYNKNGTLESITNQLLITNKSIMQYNDGVLSSSGLDSVFVSETGLETFSSNGEEIIKYYDTSSITLNLSYTKNEIFIFDNELNSRFKIVLYTKDSRLYKYLLFENVTLLAENNEGVIAQREGEYIFIGEYNYSIMSRRPTYVSNYEIIFTYEKEESSSYKQFVISNISISRVVYNTKEYVLQNGQVMERIIHTIKYTNIPGQFINNKVDRFVISIPYLTIYKVHPTIKYYEKSLVSPKYIDKNGKYITVANKFNQNIITNSVYIRSQYTHTEGDFSIGKRINPYSEHVLESINQKYVMIGNMNKIGSINDIAITSNDVYAIPISSKMLLSLEFS